MSIDRYSFYPRSLSWVLDAGNEMRLGIDPVPRRVSPDDLSLSLYEISLRVDDDVLVSLTRTPLWREVQRATNDQNWWYRRTQKLVKIDLKPRIGDWQGVYASLSRSGIAFNGFLDYSNSLVVPVLLELGVDPSMNQSSALYGSVEYGTLANIMLLLQDPRVQVDSGIKRAIDVGRADVLQLLLADPRAKTANLRPRDLDRTMDQGRMDILQIVIDSGLVHLGLEFNHAIVHAVEIGDNEIVSLLLKQKDVDPVGHELRTVDAAIERGYEDTLQLLLSDPRVRNAVTSGAHDLHASLERAVIGNKLSIVRMIVEAGYDLGDGEVSLLDTAIRSSEMPMVKLMLSYYDDDPKFRRGVLTNLLIPARRRHRKDVEQLLLSEIEVM